MRSKAERDLDKADRAYEKALAAHAWAQDRARVALNKMYAARNRRDIARKAWREHEGP